MDLWIYSLNVVNRQIKRPAATHSHSTCKMLEILFLLVDGPGPPVVLEGVLD